MAGFVPGRDRFTIEALDPDEARRLQTLESDKRQARLDKNELAELEREQTGTAAPEVRRSLLDRLIRRR
jgi:hypothetical protein